MENNYNYVDCFPSVSFLLAISCTKLTVQLAINEIHIIYFTYYILYKVKYKVNIFTSQPYDKYSLVGRYKKIDTGMKLRFVPENVLSFYRHRCSPGALGNHETRGGKEARRRKFIKYLKVRKRLLSPVAINFHLHFIFVSFVTAREWSGIRTNDGGGGKKTAKRERKT